MLVCSHPGGSCPDLGSVILMLRVHSLRVGTFRKSIQNTVLLVFAVLLAPVTVVVILAIVQLKGMQRPSLSACNSKSAFSVFSPASHRTGMWADRPSSSAGLKVVCDHIYFWSPLRVFPLCRCMLGMLAAPPRTSCC